MSDTNDNDDSHQVDDLVWLDGYVKVRRIDCPDRAIIEFDRLTLDEGVAPADAHAIVTATHHPWQFQLDIAGQPDTTLPTLELALAEGEAVLQLEARRLNCSPLTVWFDETEPGVWQPTVEPVRPE